MQTEQVFRLNHLGFPKNAHKRFAYTGADGSGRFTLCAVRDSALVPVWEGRMERHESDAVSDACFTGDFSDFRTEGVYRLQVGDGVSRIFYIDDNSYDSLSRMMAQFFVWQRCGDKKGWNGLCHMDDRLTDKFGEVHPLNGGHHQSGELRKWAFGVPRGIWGLSETLKLRAPLWNDGEMEYDIAHSVKYFLNRQSREGYIFDCSFVPVDYDSEKCHGKGFGDYSCFHKPFRYYDRPCDQSGLWSTLLMFASAADSLKTCDPGLARRAEEGAYRLWDYMQETGRYTESHDWVDYPPIGHDAFKETYFDLYYEDSLPNLVSEVYCGIALCKLNPDSRIRARVVSSLDKIAELTVCDGENGVLWFRRSRKDATPARVFSANAPLAFALALEAFPEDEHADRWRDICTRCLNACLAQAGRNAYGIVTNSPDGFYDYCFVSDHAYTVLFLSKISAILPDGKSALPLAQRMLDFIVGFNPADVSAVEGVGYNQAQHALFGEYFPSQPQIPGGVFTGFTRDKYGVDTFGIEYDMPLTGEYLYAVNEYLKALQTP